MKKIGIIGFGRIGQIHFKNLIKLEGVSVVGVADVMQNEESKNLLLKHGITNYVKDANLLMEDENIDIIFVCSSTNTHAEVCIKSAKNKKDIFCEKPISFKLDEIEEVLKTVKENDVKFQIGFNRRFDKNFLALHEAIKAGDIGNVNILKITSRDPQSPPLEYVKKSGGIFQDMSIHDFDMARYLVNSDVEEVFVLADTLINEEIKEYNDVDTAIISLRFANGAIGVIDNSREACYGYDQRAEVFGCKGKVLIDNERTSLMVKSTKDGVELEKPLFFFLERYMESFKTEVKLFIQSILNDEKLVVSGEDGKQAYLIAKASQKSYEEKRIVKLSEIKE